MIDKHLAWLEEFDIDPKTGKEMIDCSNCGGQGCPYCGGPEADYHTMCFDCSVCNGTGKVDPETGDMINYEHGQDRQAQEEPQGSQGQTHQAGQEAPEPGRYAKTLVTASFLDADEDWPDLEDVTHVAHEVAPEAGQVADPGAVQGAIGATRTARDYGAHRDVFDTAADLIDKVQRQQAITNGNKRTASILGLAMLEDAGYDTEGINHAPKADCPFCLGNGIVPKQRANGPVPVGAKCDWCNGVGKVHPMARLVYGLSDSPDDVRHTPAELSDFLRRNCRKTKESKTRLVLPESCPNCKSDNTLGRYNQAGWREYFCSDCGNEFKSRKAVQSSQDTKLLKHLDEDHDKPWQLFAGIEDLDAAHDMEHASGDANHTHPNGKIAQVVRQSEIPEKCPKCDADGIWSFGLKTQNGDRPYYTLECNECGHPMDVFKKKGHVGDDDASHHSKVDKFKEKHPYWSDCPDCHGDGVDVTTTSADGNQKSCGTCKGLGESHDFDYWDSDKQLHDFPNYPAMKEMKVPDKALKSHIKEIHPGDYEDPYGYHQQQHGLNVDPQITEILLEKKSHIGDDSMAHHGDDFSAWDQATEAQMNSCPSCHSDDHYEMSPGHHRCNACGEHWGEPLAADLPRACGVCGGSGIDDYGTCANCGGYGKEGGQAHFAGFKESVNRTREWYLHQRDNAREMYGPGSEKTIHDFGDGWSIKKLQTAGDAGYEGLMQRNCIGGVRDAEADCRRCGGTGDCTSCDGRGGNECINCFGMGSEKCRDCKGKGWLEEGHPKRQDGDDACPTCRSEGYVQCYNCKGKGSTGECSDCASTGKCARCKGNGQQKVTNNTPLDEMEHDYRDVNGNSMIHSLRDPDDIPKVSFTIENYGDEGTTLGNFFGRGNSLPKPEYASKVTQFFKNYTKDKPGKHEVNVPDIDLEGEYTGMDTRMTPQHAHTYFSGEVVNKTPNEDWAVRASAGDTTYPFALTQTPNLVPQPRGSDPWQDFGANDGIPLNNPGLVFDKKLQKWITNEQLSGPSEVNHPGNGLMSQAEKLAQSWDVADSYYRDPDHNVPPSNSGQPVRLPSLNQGDNGVEPATPPTGKDIKKWVEKRRTFPGDKPFADHPTNQSPDDVNMRQVTGANTNKEYRDKRDLVLKQINTSGGKYRDKSSIAHRFEDGWSIKRLNTYGDLRYEGNMMGNCIAGVAENTCSKCDDIIHNYNNDTEKGNGKCKGGQWPSGDARWGAERDHSGCKLCRGSGACNGCGGSGLTVKKFRGVDRDKINMTPYSLTSELGETGAKGTHIYSLRNPDNVPVTSFYFTKDSYDKEKGAPKLTPPNKAKSDICYDCNGKGFEEDEPLSLCRNCKGTGHEKRGWDWEDDEKSIGIDSVYGRNNDTPKEPHARRILDYARSLSRKAKGQNVNISWGQSGYGSSTTYTPDEMDDILDNKKMPKGNLLVVHHAPKGEAPKDYLLGATKRPLDEMRDMLESRPIRPTDGTASKRFTLNDFTRGQASLHAFAPEELGNRVQYNFLNNEHSVSLNGLNKSLLDSHKVDLRKNPPKPKNRNSDDGDLEKTAGFEWINEFKVEKLALFDYDPVRDVQPSSESAPAPSAQGSSGDPWTDLGDNGISPQPRPGLIFDKKLKKWIQDEQATWPDVGVMFPGGATDVNKIGKKSKTVLVYHVSPTSNRESILSQGLTKGEYAGREWGKVLTNPENWNGDNFDTSISADIWRARIPRGLQTSTFDEHPVPPEDVELVHTWPGKKMAKLANEDSPSDWAIEKAKQELGQNTPWPIVLNRARMIEMPAKQGTGDAAYNWARWTEQDGDDKFLVTGAVCPYHKREKGNELPDFETIRTHGIKKCMFCSGGEPVNRVKISKVSATHQCIECGATDNLELGPDERYHCVDGDRCWASQQGTDVNPDSLADDGETKEMDEPDDVPLHLLEQHHMNPDELKWLHNSGDLADIHFNIHNDEVGGDLQDHYHTSYKVSKTGQVRDYSVLACPNCDKNPGICPSCAGRNPAGCICMDYGMTKKCVRCEGKGTVPYIDHVGNHGINPDGMSMLRMEQTHDNSHAGGQYQHTHRFTQVLPQRPGDHQADNGIDDPIKDSWGKDIRKLLPRSQETTPESGNLNVSIDNQNKIGSQQEPVTDEAKHVVEDHHFPPEIIESFNSQELHELHMEDHMDKPWGHNPEALKVAHQ